MERKNIIPKLTINRNSIVPKYKQLIQGILCIMEQGEIMQHDILPSIHQLCTGLDVSRNTVEKAYSKLKLKGIIGSVHGKGFFCTANQNQTL